MPHAARQQQVTRLLQRFSARFDELILELRRQAANPPPAELVDEIAGTAGELMLALVNHRAAFEEGESVRKAIGDAARLREAARAQGLRREQIAAAVLDVTRDVDQIIREDKRAA